MRRFLIMLITVLSALFLSSCGRRSQPAFTETSAEVVSAYIASLKVQEGVHEREEGYMSMFSTHALALDGLTVHMENRVYDEVKLRALTARIFADIGAAELKTGAKPGEVTVYIVGTTVDGVSASVGASVFCTEEDVESGEYRPALMGAVYGFKTEWQRVGLTEYVFLEDAYNLKAYYSSGEHALTASVSPLYLSPYSADAETVAAARSTARSLTSFVIEKEGFDALLKADEPAQYLSAWAEAEGITGLSELPEGHEKLKGMRLVPSGRGLFEFSIDNFTVYVSDESWMKAPDELYSWACGFLAGLEKVVDMIEAELPSFREIVEERLNESISIFMVDEMEGTYAYPAQNRIDLSRYDATWHEMVHLLLEENSYNESYRWICEGLAEHFSLDVTSEYCPEYYVSSGFDAYLTLFEEINGFPAAEDDMVYHEKVWQLYNELRSPGMEDHDDQYAYERAFGICKLLLDERLERTQIRRIYDLSVAAKRGMTFGPKRTDGNALTYPESMIMVEYLFERFGADAVFSAYYNGESLNKAFGMTYTEIYDAVMAELSERYAYLIAAE